MLDDGGTYRNAELLHETLELLQEPGEGEGDEILTFMQKRKLQLLLPRGTQTYEHYNGTNPSTDRRHNDLGMADGSLGQVADLRHGPWLRSSRHRVPSRG